MNGTRPAGGRLAHLARRLGYRTRAVSWTALCALGTLLSQATVTDD
ncbi:hypothetical protein ACFY00_20450 [Kitasatospora sp. NPDC001540]